MSAATATASSRHRLRSPLAHRGKDPGQARFNQEVTDVLRQLLIGPAGGYSVVDATLSATPTRVSHGLGRPWQGWAVVDKTSNATVFRVGAPAGQPDDSATHVFLQASAPTTVRVYFF